MDQSAFYDDYWRSGLHLSDEWNQHRLRAVFGPILGADRLLDYGCGLGTAYQAALARAVASYTGADVSEVVLADLQKKGLPSARISHDGSIPLPSESFTAAACVEVFEHLFDPLAAAKEIFRLLSPGGILIATVPNFGYLPWRLMAALRARVPSEPEDPAKNRYNGVHIRFFSASMFRRMLTDAGFQNVSIHSFDDATIWDIFRGLGPLCAISDWARARLPRPFHLRFLQDLYPSLFAYRLRAVARKAAIA